MSAPAKFRASAVWSLWELIAKHAHLFASAIVGLEESKWHCADFQEIAAGAPPSLDHMRRFARRAAAETRVACVTGGMDSVIPEINRLDQLIDPPGGLAPTDAPTLAQALKHLVSRLKDELSSEYFFQVDGPDVQLYLSAEPFGSQVSKKFPKAIEDIAEAAKCLAIQRHTAAVFHLMRVMELALRALAKKLMVTAINPEIESWNKITNHVNMAINALPAKTAPEQARKAKFGAASAHLNSVRIAWRNEVMHPKQSYSREEAHAIFSAVRAFMIDLAGLR